MKFFRWILSHLTLIVVLTLVIYIYWNRNEIWPDAVPEEQIKERSTEQSIEPLKAKPIENTDSDETLSTSKLISTENQSRSDSRTSNNFSERMKQYRKALPVEEQEVMEKAAETFQQVADDTIKYPAEAIDGTIKYPTEAIDGTIKYPTETIIDLKREDSEDIKATTSVENEVSEQLLNTAVASTQALDATPKEVTIADNVDVYDSPENGLNENFDVVISQSASAVSPLADNSANIKKDNSEMQNKNLQQQIRNRQKQLQNQMVMLVPFNSVNNKRNSKKLEPVKAVINTPEQRRLLKAARKAFDEQEFDQAEAKYLQLIEQLPELPDVRGELANVYRTQNRTSEYLAANTQFVKRLVNHNRFNEAWKVVKVTDKLDKTIAEQQRRIIKRKQEAKQHKNEKS